MFVQTCEIHPSGPWASFPTLPSCPNLLPHTSERQWVFPIKSIYIAIASFQIIMPVLLELLWWCNSGLLLSGLVHIYIRTFCSQMSAYSGTGEFKTALPNLLEHLDSREISVIKQWLPDCFKGVRSWPKTLPIYSSVKMDDLLPDIPKQILFSGQVDLVGTPVLLGVGGEVKTEKVTCLLVDNSGELKAFLLVIYF